MMRIVKKNLTTKLSRKPPHTNLGCESEFGFVTNDFKEKGGSTSLATISDKHIVARNKIYKPVKERKTAKIQMNLR